MEAELKPKQPQVRVVSVVRIAPKRSKPRSRITRSGDNIPRRPRIQGSDTKLKGYEHLIGYAFWYLRKQPEWTRVMTRYTWQGDTWPDGFRESELRMDLEQELYLLMLSFMKIGHIPTTEDARRRIIDTMKTFMLNYGLMIPVTLDNETGEELPLTPDESYEYDDRWPWRTPFRRTDWTIMKTETETWDYELES